MTTTSANPNISTFPNKSIDELRAPPFSMEAEEAVIGGLLIDNEAWDIIMDMVEENDFYKKEHRVFFRMIRVLLEADQPFDAITVADRLKDAGEASESSLASLLSLAKDTPSAANISAYANIVREKSIRRKLVATANSIIEQTNQAGDDLNGVALLDNAEQKIFEIAEADTNKRKDFEPLGHIGKEAYKQIAHRSKQKGYITGVPTGYQEFDKQTSGLQKGDLIIIAGRPSMGKTSLAVNIAEYAAFHNSQINEQHAEDAETGDTNKGVVAIFSMEMPASQLALRFYASLARIDLMRLRQGNLRDEEWPRITSAMNLMQGASVYIDDTSTLSPFQIRARARRLMREHKGLSLIVVDYLQLMRLEHRTDNRVVEISEISRALKALARELNVPVIALSQLNRSLESREDKRPVMSDLRESGAIEQDADLILFVYREEVYKKEPKEKGVAEIIVAKQRNGPQFTTKLTFLKEVTRFENHFPAGSYPGLEDNPDSDPTEEII